MNVRLPNFSAPTGAVFSECDRYRYVLWRTWKSALPMVLFIALNPSIADAAVNDPTMRRCIGFAQSWGYGGMIVANLFAYRATKPTTLRQANDPVGPEGDRWIERLCRYAVEQDGPEQEAEGQNNAGKTIILAWGNHGKWQGRDRTVLEQIQCIVPQPHCLAITKQGQPSHPLYLPKTLRPMPFREVGWAKSVRTCPSRELK